MPVDPWLSPPLLSALPGRMSLMMIPELRTNSYENFPFPGFLSHPQNVYPSYLTPPLALNHSNLNMSQLNMVASHGHHHNGGLRISPPNMQLPHQSHIPPPHSVAVPVTSSPSSMMPQTSTHAISPQHNLSHSPHLSIRTPSPDKKSTDLNVDSDDPMNKDSAINMTISQSATTDIRTNSIAALRIKAKEHLDNINKNLTMV